ncbi:MAG: inner membrane-spanning protein YciB [Sphingomonadaceae bacterium]|nr:inner membrane-spanning protein YciB [Sphingomonadaceae bacterium]
MTEKRELSTGLKLAIDYGPLLVFFGVNSQAPGSDVDQAVWATAAFMVATAIAMLVSKLKTGRISTMLWVTGVVVAVFGGLTIYLHDERFIQIKPSIVYAVLSGTLFFGLLTGRPLLRTVLESGFPALKPEGWHKLTRNFAWFFLAMVGINEVARQMLSFDSWVTFKVWGVSALSFAFMFTQLPMLMKHSDEPQDPPIPPQG